MDMRDWSTDRIERLAIDAEAEIARQRAVQAAALAELDRRQAPSADGRRAPYPTADAVGAPSPCR